ncbi:SRPBCC domain-containing protein [Flavobacterium sp. MFBS3-15]|uniref:SRPBCC family protein n=1 Tax=Flavobacterium sp. MFBS3-15 TaxID=2989816 RepID=UPI0022354CB3|nr:SRPBCC domain-containing protein [Flavobacterium sp. MFBS3-15]MCW4468543.1 SRPBCC domain-containing protein [Flavobacterium sp. MFBS3-15]
MKTRLYPPVLLAIHLSSISIAAGTHLINKNQIKIMENQDYTKTFLLRQTPQQVFDAITNVPAWWAEDFRGASKKLNDEFEARFFTNVHYSKQKLTEVIPNKKIVWLVTDSRLSFLKDKEEWTGTEVIFEIAEKNGKTELHFTHKGLRPQIECYKDCTNGWTQFLDNSLIPLITTGKGNPKVLEGEVAEKTGQSYTTAFSVSQSPAEVYTAITNVSKWWSEQVDGGTSEKGDEFTYQYKDVHISKMRIEEALPDKKIIWRVLNNHFNFISDETEWVGTRIIFEIQEKDGKTELRFTHDGLVPDYECYEICHDAWTSYIQGSLKSLITTGKGNPNTREEGLSTELIEKWGLPKK